MKLHLKNTEVALPPTGRYVRHGTLHTDFVLLFVLVFFYINDNAQKLEVELNG